MSLESLLQIVTPSSFKLVHYLDENIHKIVLPSQYY